MSKTPPPCSISSSVSYSSQPSGTTTLTSSSISPPVPPLPFLPTPLSTMSIEHSKRISVISNDVPGLTSELIRINNLINAAKDRKSEDFRELLRYYGNLLGQQRYVFEECLSSQNLLHLHNRNPQHRTGPKKDVVERKLDAMSDVESIPNATLESVVSGTISFLRQTLEVNGITQHSPATSPKGPSNRIVFFRV